MCPECPQVVEVSECSPWGEAAPDFPAAVGWYRRAADAGNASAANNLFAMYTVGRGRASKTMPMHAPSSFTSRPSSFELKAGLPTSIFGVLKAVRIRPNPTLYRIRPNPEPISGGSKCPYRLPNTAKKSPAGPLGIRPNPPESAQIQPSTESVRIPNRHPRLKGITRRGEQYLPGPRTRRHAQQAAGSNVAAQVH